MKNLLLLAGLCLVLIATVTNPVQAGAVHNCEDPVVVSN
jgi:hypothetical protein